MGVVKGFKGAGIFAKIAFILLILAAIGAWIAYNSTGWGRCETGASDTHYGLWRECSDNTYTSGCVILDGWALGKCSYFFTKYFISDQRWTDKVQQMMFLYLNA